MSESAVQRAIMLGIGSRPDVRIWRNNTAFGVVGDVTWIRGRQQVALNPGDAVVRKARPLHSGLCKGSSDLIGVQRVLIGPEHVGQTIGRFLAPEIKDDGRLTDDQCKFLACINEFGGLGFVARSVDDANQALGPSLFDAPRRAGGAR